MIKILIAFFNSLFFFAVFFLFFQNLVVASIVAGVVCLVTFFALSLSTMAHDSNNVFDVRNAHLQPKQDSFQYISQAARPRDTSPIFIQKNTLTKIPDREEPVYWKSN